MSRNEYDINLRSLVADYSQDFLHWLVSDTARVEEVVNPVFASRERRADFVMRYSTSTGDSGILHIEFQRQAIPEMPLRMMEYALSIVLNHGKAPRQVLILLENSRTAREMPDAYEDEGLRVQYRVIRLWEQDPAVILAGSLPGLIPLVSLMGPLDKLMDRLEVCEAAIAEQVELKSEQQDLLAIATLLTSLQPKARDVVEKFIRSRRMVDLMESPLLKDWLREAEEKGEVKEGQRMLVRLLSRKFGKLPTSLLSDLEAITSAGQLEKLLDVAVDATSLNEFRKQLDS